MKIGRITLAFVARAIPLHFFWRLHDCFFVRILVPHPYNFR